MKKYKQTKEEKRPNQPLFIGCVYAASAKNVFCIQLDKAESDKTVNDSWQ